MSTRGVLGRGKFTGQLRRQRELDPPLEEGDWLRGPCEHRKGTRAVPPTQFSSSSFRGSVSSSTSSFTFPFFLPFPFPLAALVVAVGGFFSFSVALLSVGGARFPRGCSSSRQGWEMD